MTWLSPQRKKMKKTHQTSLFKTWREKGLMTAIYSQAQNKPLQQGIILIATYFLMDAYLLNVHEDGELSVIVAALFLTFGMLYLLYVHGYAANIVTNPGKDIPGFVKHPRRYVVVVFGILTLLTTVVMLSYDEGITKLLPNIEQTYYKSQFIHLVLIAPVVEELSFRYFLYDRWAKVKFGPVKGILLTSFLFVICHPVGDLNGLILYWVPTLLFYMMYDSFGLYGSILSHIIFNFIAS